MNRIGITQLERTPSQGKRILTVIPAKAGIQGYHAADSPCATGQMSLDRCHPADFPATGFLLSRK